MRTLGLLTISIVWATLVGCSTLPSVDMAVASTDVQRQIYPRPSKPAPTPPAFKVLGQEHEATCGSSIEEARALFCLNPKQYGILAVGLTELIEYLHQLEDLLEIYERERSARNAELEEPIPETE